ARQTCFCGLLRLATTASSSRRSEALNRMFVRSCIPQTRTHESARKSPSESKCQIWSTRRYYFREPSARADWKAVCVLANRSITDKRAIMRNNLIYTGFLFMTVLCTGASGTSSDSIPMIDQFVSAEMSRQKIPGMALAVVKNGEVVAAKGYGFA